MHFFIYNVIIFNFITDPPFEQATKNDKWYKPLIKGNIQKFWKAHRKSPIATNLDAKGIRYYIYIYIFVCN